MTPHLLILTEMLLVAALFYGSLRFAVWLFERNQYAKNHVSAIGHTLSFCGVIIIASALAIAEFLLVGQLFANLA